MTRPRVTPAERHEARQQDEERRKVIRLGMDFATRIGTAAQLAAARAMRRGAPLGPAATAELERAAPLLRDCMVAAHLYGRRRSIVSAPVPIAAAGYQTPQAIEKAIEFMRRRLEMPADELDLLAAVYESEALKVVNKASAAVESRLEGLVAKLTESGEHVREGKAALAGAFELAGLTPNNSFTLEAIWRTQTATAYSAGKWQNNQSDEMQEILWGYKYTTVGDDRVREEHVGFDGVTLEKDDPFWDINWPPNGFCCRCATINIFEEREAVQPQEVEVDGMLVMPSADKGFQFNPGQVFAVGA